MSIKTRGSGVLLHIISLPGAYGIGDLGPGAFQFVDILAQAKQKFWQILPIHPTDGINGHSPYSCFSAFAGNTLLISPDLLVKDGWLRKNDLTAVPVFPRDRIDYQKVTAYKNRLFEIVYRRFKRGLQEKPEYRAFCFHHKYWLDDYAVFVVAKALYGGRAWNEWPKAMKGRDPRALKLFQHKYHEEIEKAKFLQYLFFKQWFALKSYCQKKGIEIIGDISIYINYDGADVWRHPKIFKLDKQGGLKFVSGVPPDYFSKTGQRWGNPVYDWKQLKKEKYRWWVDRIGHSLALFDHIRIDHFRGFAGYWQIPAHERIAVFGRWERGPGAGFFKYLERKFSELPIIAEDLGYITPDVLKLMKQFRFPGMRVLLFAFGGDMRSNPHVPDNYARHCVVYTGTHDNNTIQGWFQNEATFQEKENLYRYLDGRVSSSELHWQLIKLVMNSVANMAIIPLPDVLGLGEEARINTPATQSRNWQWRLKPKAITASAIKKLRQLVVSSKRA